MTGGGGVGFLFLLIAFAVLSLGAAAGGGIGALVAWIAGLNAWKGFFIGAGIVDAVIIFLAVILKGASFGQ